MDLLRPFGESLCLGFVPRCVVRCGGVFALGAGAAVRARQGHGAWRPPRLRGRMGRPGRRRVPPCAAHAREALETALPICFFQLLLSRCEGSAHSWWCCSYVRLAAPRQRSEVEQLSCFFGAGPFLLSAVQQQHNCLPTSSGRLQTVEPMQKTIMQQAVLQTSLQQTVLQTSM